MSQNDNNSSANNAVGMGLALIAVLMLVAFYLLMFVAFVLSIICFFAWNKPVRIGKHVLMPEEARSFVKRGLAGAFLFPAFIIFLEVFFGIRVNGDYLMHIVMGGYMLGSVGYEMFIGGGNDEQVPAQTIIPPNQQIAPPPSPPAPPRPPFRFASWNDEDGR